MVKQKGTKKETMGYGKEGEDEGDVVISQSPEKVSKKVIPPEYTRGIRKIASYSGVTRVMKCGDKKCGAFDEIVNIYVYPDGIETGYPDTIIDPHTKDHSISKNSVRKHGQKELAIWGRKEAAAGNPYDNVDTATPSARRKKASRPVRRMTVPKRGNLKKRK